MGNARTCMIANISPNSSSTEHTLNTLRYSDRYGFASTEETWPFSSCASCAFCSAVCCRVRLAAQAPSRLSCASGGPTSHTLHIIILHINSVKELKKSAANLPNQVSPLSLYCGSAQSRILTPRIRGQLDTARHDPSRSAVLLHPRGQCKTLALVLRNSRFGQQ